MLFQLCILLHVLLFKIIINGNNIKYQNQIIPFMYKNINVKDIKRIKLVTKMSGVENDTSLHDVMYVYGMKGKLFSASMDLKNSECLYHLAISHGVRVQDKRKK